MSNKFDDWLQKRDPELYNDLHGVTTDAENTDTEGAGTADTLPATTTTGTDFHTFKNTPLKK